MFVYYLMALLLTVLIEEFIALFFGRDKLFLLSVILVNIITHTVFCFILFSVENIFGLKIDIILILLLELLIVISEFLLLVYVGFRRTRMLVFSFLSNSASFFIGLLLIRAGLLPGLYIFS